MPDADVAEKIGRTAVGVALRRQALRIAAFTAQQAGRAFGE